MNITYIHSASNADRHRVQVRCRNLAAAVMRTGIHQAQLVDLEAFARQTPAARSACAAADLLVVHRYLYGPILRVMQSWMARDKKVMVDIDEPLTLLPSDSAAYRFWHEGVPFPGCGDALAEDGLIAPVPIDQLRMATRLADGVSVSSARLADDWVDAGNVVYIPDYVNADQYLTVKQDHPGEIRLGLNVEGLSSDCLAKTGLKFALEAVCAKRKNVRIMMVGFDVNSECLPKVDTKQITMIPAVSVEDWPLKLAQMDLGLAPAEGSYGSRASRLRPIEFMLMKIPWVGSDLPLYRELSRFGWMVQNTAGTWERALLEVIDHLDAYRTEAAGEAFFYALSQDVNENIGKILTAYTSVLYKMSGTRGHG